MRRFFFWYTLGLLFNPSSLYAPDTFIAGAGAVSCAGFPIFFDRLNFMGPICPLNHFGFF